MADYGACYASGAGQTYANQSTQQHRDSGNQQQPPRPPVAPGPSGYQQYGASSPQSQQQHSHQQAGQDGVNGLAAQMNNLDMATAPARLHRKKDRHAHHDLGQSGPAPQTFTSTPPPTSSQFVSQQQPATGTAGQPGQGMFVNPADKLRMGEEAVTTQGRVDPEQIPSIARARDAATHQYQTQVYPTMEKHLPPPAAVPFVAHDQGNSSPKHARLTINSIPSTSESLASRQALPHGSSSAALRNTSRRGAAHSGTRLWRSRPPKMSPVPDLHQPLHDLPIRRQQARLQYVQLPERRGSRILCSHRSIRRPGRPYATARAHDGNRGISGAERVLGKTTCSHCDTSS